jgi:hypothetical protein
MKLVDTRTITLPAGALVGMVIARELASDFTEALQALGRGWMIIPSMFPRMAYVVAVATTNDRMDKGAPMVYGCTREPELRDIVELACEQLEEGARVFWFLIVRDTTQRAQILDWIKPYSEPEPLH